MAKSQKSRSAKAGSSTRKKKLTEDSEDLLALLAFRCTKIVARTAIALLLAKLGKR